MATLKIRLPNDGRVAFVGATGSGKTVLSKFFLSAKNRAVVIDPKHTFQLDGYRVAWKLPLVKKDFRVVVRPYEGEDDRLAALLFKLIHESSLTIYIDELAVLSELFPYSTKILQNIAVTGRELGISLWTAVQRPRRTPRVFFSETETFFIFRLRSGEDRDYLREFAGDPVLLKLPKYQFWYSQADAEGDPPLLNLDLRTNTIIPVRLPIDGPMEVA